MTNFNWDENGLKFSERVENAVGKGEIACYEQFLLFPKCFQKTWSADTLKQGLVWEKVNNHEPLMNKAHTKGYEMNCWALALVQSFSAFVSWNDDISW